ncbi:hypothetical protein T440DRAFT_151232 [Plenodomus tracheiphilus IPT5]|uniref:Uncharacterized protein n=1 Tax=Plenodomus tracheiphilus IPT5 TaxID=1408161 RepID=A0A6A7AZE6_9PLEO|nr:hypothetical protein T440DRAFT_151232 [Plenodomus tracheiphilus IPT5]
MFGSQVDVVSTLTLTRRSGVFVHAALHPVWLSGTPRASSSPAPDEPAAQQHTARARSLLTYDSCLASALTYTKLQRRPSLPLIPNIFVLPLHACTSYGVPSVTLTPRGALPAPNGVQHPSRLPPCSAHSRTSSTMLSERPQTRI